MNEHYPKDDLGKISFWESQLKLAEEHQRPYMEAGARVVKLYNNMATTLREKDLESLDVDNNTRVKGSIVFAWVDQSVANMIEPNTSFNVSPKTSVSTNGSDVVQSAINYWYDETEQDIEDYKMCLDAHLLPFAVKKLGWNSVVDSQEDIYFSNVSDIIEDDVDSENLILLQGEPTRPTIHQDHEEHIYGHLVLLETPNLPEEVESIVRDHVKMHEDLQRLGSQPEISTTVQWEAPFGTRWQPDDYLQDPLATNGVKDARWIAFRVRQPLHWWKTQDNFKNTEDLKPNAFQDQNRKYESQRMSESSFEDYGLVEGWEIWARNFPVGDGETRDVLITMVPGHDKLIREDLEWPYDNIEDYPVSLLQFQENVKTWINKPTLTMAGADNIQSLINEFFDSMLYTIRKQKNIWLYDKNLFTEEEMSNVLNAPDGSVFGVDGLEDTKGILPLPFQSIPGDKQQMMGLIQNYFDRTAGTPQPIRNNTPETATEASIIERRNTAREEARRFKFMRMKQDTARKFWQLHQQFRPDREFLIDPRTQEWASVDEEIAKGEYRFRIDVSNRAASQAVERKNWLDLFNLLVGTVPAFLNLQLPPPNILKVLEMLLRRGYDIQDPEQFIPVSPTGFMDALQKLQGDPQQMALMLQSFDKLGGGGAFGPMGASPGPADPQQFAASASAPQKQAQTAQNSTGQV